MAGEDADVYKALARDNLNRQYDFLTSIIRATLSAERMLGRSLDEKLTETIIKALNFHAVACLDHPAGTYRTTEVRVGPYNPPEASNVPRLMREFVSEANAMWDSADPVSLSAACLWVVNHIHPFVKKWEWAHCSGSLLLRTMRQNWRLPWRRSDSS